MSGRESFHSPNTFAIQFNTLLQDTLSCLRTRLRRLRLNNTSNGFKLKVSISLLVSAFQRLETLWSFMLGGSIYANYDSLLKVSRSISIHSVDETSFRVSRPIFQINLFHLLLRMTWSITLVSNTNSFHEPNHEFAFRTRWNCNNSNREIRENKHWTVNENVS